MTETTAEPTPARSHPFDAFWHEATEGRFACPTWPLDATIRAKLHEKETRLQELGFHLLFAHEFEFGLPLRGAVGAKKHWLDKRTALATELGDAAILKFNEQDVFNCDCYNDPVLKPLLEPRLGPGQWGEGYQDHKDVYEMRLKPQRSEQQMENVHIFWERLLEKAKDYNIRILPLGTHTHGSLHRVSTGENIFDMTQATPEKLDIYKRVLQGMFPVCVQAAGYLLDPFKHLHSGKQTSSYVRKLLRADLEKKSLLRMAEKTIELRSNQSPTRYHPALEYLTYASGVLEGLEPSLAEPYCNVIQAKRGTFTGAAGMLEEILQYSAINQDGTLSPPFQAMLRQKTADQLRQELHLKPTIGTKELRAFFEATRVNADGTLSWPSTTALVASNPGKQNAARAKLKAVRCVSQLPCLYVREMLKHEAWDAHALLFKLLCAGGASEIVDHHFGRELNEAISDAAINDFQSYNANEWRLRAIRHNATMSSERSIALPA